MGFLKKLAIGAAVCTTLVASVAVASFMSLIGVTTLAVLVAGAFGLWTLTLIYFSVRKMFRSFRDRFFTKRTKASTLL